MSSYSSKIIILLFTLFLLSCSHKNIIQNNKHIYNLNENILVSLALDYEFNKDYINSQLVYEELLSYNPNNIDYLHKLIYLNIKLKQYDNAIKYSSNLINIDNNSRNNSIKADIYYMKYDYLNASKYYEKSYNINHNIKSLLNLSDIKFHHLNQKKGAILLLNKHIKNYDCLEKICVRLLSYYEKNNDVKNMIKIVNILLEKYKDTYSKKKILKLKNLLINLYINANIDKAIILLENSEIDNQKLLNLYSIKKDYKKALILLGKMYKKNKDASLLGQMAILEYEKNNNKINKNIINNFEKSLKYKSNAIYENYYGYILVSDNINIQKGLNLIKKALKKVPNNFAFQDSLAYAYYKNNNCEQAYKIMSRIVKEIGLDNIDIKRHWEEIKNCKDRK